MSPAQPPRVALFAHRLAVAAPTGINRYTVELTRALAGRPLLDGPAEWSVSATREPDRPEWVPRGVRVRPVPGPRRAVHLAWTGLHRPVIERLIGGLDLLHVLTPVVPVATRRPLVVTVHDVLPLTRPEWYRPRERWLNGAALAQAVAQAHVIVPSRAVAAELRRVLGTPARGLSVIPEGVSAPAPPDPAERAAVLRRYDLADGGYLLFVGAVAPRKNLGVLFEALAAAARAHPDLVLVAAGPHPPDAAATLQAARRHGVADRVRFPGFVAERELRALLAGALALVHPSAYEGFGLTVLEAMAAGAPVASSDAGSLPEVVGDAGLLIDPADPGAWQAGIERLAGDPRLRARLRERGRRRAAGFTWQRAAAATLAVYEGLLGGPAERDPGAAPQGQRGGVVEPHL